MKYITVPFHKSYDRTKFTSGETSLDNYIKKQVRQDIRKKLCVCFLLIDKNAVIGFYTLSNHSIPLDEIPDGLRKKMPPSYKNLPSILLGRLAVDKSQHGKGVGQHLLIDALKRSLYAATNSIGAMSVIVDPLNEPAETFYLKYGFIKLPDSGKMFISMKTISQLPFSK